MRAPGEQRRYRILGVLGQGGFGRVYKARLEGPRGFVKDVAIKLLTDEDPPEDVLRRFRDECRILGLVRDRAVVAVDPPVQLQGRWALVMEFVEGESLSALLRRLGRFPPKVALEIIQEAARTLDKVYHHRGPDGLPLHLLHRDIKPANFQLTPSGELKVLDFGIARARFDAREAVTTHNIAGTVGYIAPERLDRVEGPAGDVYSLGIVLKILLSGLNARALMKKKLAKAKYDEDVRPGLDLADHMTLYNHLLRPGAREVEEACRELGEELTGPGLRHWAEKHVLSGPMDVEDELVGTVLTETPTQPLRPPPVPAPAPDPEPTPVSATDTRTLLAATLGSLTTALGLGLLVASVGVAWLASQWLAPPPPTEADASLDVVLPAEGSGTAEVDRSPKPMPPAPDEAPRAAPAPAPEQPVALPPPEPAATLQVVLTSEPLGAQVFVDGVALGKTPLIDHPLAAGDHSLRMVAGEASISERITVRKRGANRFVWRVGQGLEVGY